MTTTTTIPSMNSAQGANPLKGLLSYGQSPWLDFIRRNILLNGDLKKMINEDGLRGMTSNPAIFEKAITAGNDYDDIIKAADAKSSTAMALYEKIAIRDVRAATATSASKFRRFLRSTLRARSTKHAASGKRSTGPT